MEKAKDLYDNFYGLYPEQDAQFIAIECALIAVDEIIDAIDWHEYEVPNDQLKFWFEVKREIESYDS